jgi:hypothetical protein
MDLDGIAGSGFSGHPILAPVEMRAQGNSAVSINDRDVGDTA